MCILFLTQINDCRHLILPTSMNLPSLNFVLLVCYFIKQDKWGWDLGDSCGTGGLLRFIVGPDGNKENHLTVISYTAAGRSSMQKPLNISLQHLQEFPTLLRLT